MFTYFEKDLGSDICILVGTEYQGPTHFFKTCIGKNVILYREIYINYGLGEEHDPAIKSFNREEIIVDLKCTLFEIDKENLMLLKLHGFKNIKIICNKSVVFNKHQTGSGSSIFIKSL
jgi:hypothetical protein